MNLLKLKSFIYRCTGLYLAQSEELKYLSGREFWIEFDKILTKDLKSKDPIGTRNIKNVLIGSWQVRNGFYRKCKR